MNLTQNWPRILGLLFLCFAAITAVNPGLKARISQRGIQYAASEATRVLARDVCTMTIPDQSGSGDVDYALTNMHVTSFTPPSATVTTVPFKWSLRGTSAAVHGDWRYSYRKAFIHVSDHGSFDVSISVDISTTLTMGIDQTGRPTIHMSSCDSAVTHADVTIHGGASWLYNLFDGKIEDAIKDKLNSALCPAVKEVIDVKAAAALATMSTRLDLHNMIVLDYSLVTPPVFTQTYIDANFKGEFFWKNDTQECPLVPDPISDAPADLQMVSFWITDYSINSLGYVEYKHGTLQYELTKNDLPPSSRDVLDTTCKSLFPPCVGAVIPEVGKRYPNTSVTIGMAVTEAPVMDTDASGLSGKWSGTTVFSALLGNGTKRFMFSCNTAVNFSLTASMDDLNITATITNFTVKMSLKKSDIGSINVESLNAVMKLAIDGFVIPNLNKLGSEGMRLPEIRDVKYVNPKFLMVKNSLFVAADLRYIG